MVVQADTGGWRLAHSKKESPGNRLSDLPIRARRLRLLPFLTTAISFGRSKPKSLATTPKRSISRNTMYQQSSAGLHPHATKLWALATARMEGKGWEYAQ